MAGRRCILCGDIINIDIINDATWDDVVTACDVVTVQGMNQMASGGPMDANALVKVCALSAVWCCVLFCCVCCVLVLLVLFVLCGCSYFIGYL